MTIGMFSLVLTVTLGIVCLQIYVPPHPLIQHWLAIARNEMTPPPIFRAAIAELGRILVYEAGRDWLPTMQQQIASPVGVADATFVDPTQPVKVRDCEWCSSSVVCQRMAVFCSWEDNWKRTDA